MRSTPKLWPLRRLLARLPLAVRHVGYRCVINTSSNPGVLFSATFPQALAGQQPTIPAIPGVAVRWSMRALLHGEKCSLRCLYIYMMHAMPSTQTRLRIQVPRPAKHPHKYSTLLHLVGSLRKGGQGAMPGTTQPSQDYMLPQQAPPETCYSSLSTQHRPCCHGHAHCNRAVYAVSQNMLMGFCLAWCGQPEAASTISYSRTGHWPVWPQPQQRASQCRTVRVFTLLLALHMATAQPPARQTHPRNTITQQAV